ncbi:MAG: ABC transporter permease [Actinobacteria bacterium]|nr:ABC transporter permease [Actinomycetota bacterium]
MSRFLTQLRTELQLTLRNGEQLLLTLGIPVMLLVFFSLVDVLPTGTDDPVDFLAPGILALAVMSTSMVALGIATGFERSYHVLKRLGVTPLGRPRLVAAKIGAVAVVELVQFAVLVPVAFALGWSPSPANWALAVCAVVLGTTAFAGIGLTLAGRLRGEINLAAQNGLYLVLLLLGGMVIPFAKLPSGIRAVAHGLPSGALADVLRETLGGAGSQPTTSWIVLAVWAVVMPVVAAAVFRWD